MPSPSAVGTPRPADMLDAWAEPGVRARTVMTTAKVKLVYSLFGSIMILSWAKAVHFFLRSLISILVAPIDDSQALGSVRRVIEQVGVVVCGRIA